MIIDYNQTNNGLTVSYVNKNNLIDVEEINLPDGYYEYVETDEFDINKLEGLVSFNGSAIKKQKAHFFSHHNINEFFLKDILKHSKYPEELKALRKPSIFSVDIEVLPTKEYGYSPATEAKNPITSISITDENFETLLFEVDNGQPILTDLDRIEMRNVIDDWLAPYSDKHSFNFTIRRFATEKEMMEVFVECVNKYFHSIFGWNFLKYDWSYIYNRCNNIGVNIKKSSPIMKLQKKKIKINKKISIDVHVPIHRQIICYMNLFETSLIYNNLGSYALDIISETILKIKKVTYTGNLRTLFETDYKRFLCYGIVDTIIPMLLHKHTNLLDVDFFQSFYTNVPYNKLSQNSISEALVYKTLNKEGKFLLESEKSTAVKRPYKGGFVKTPTKKIVGACLGIDYGGLYPNIIILGGLSPESKMDVITVNSHGLPANEQENIKWLKYKSLGGTLAPSGRIYDNSKLGLYPKIELGLLDERQVFKSCMENIYLQHKQQILNEIKRRKSA